MKALELVGYVQTQSSARELELAAGKNSQSNSILNGLNVNKWEKTGKGTQSGAVMPGVDVMGCLKGTRTRQRAGNLLWVFPIAAGTTPLAGGRQAASRRQSSSGTAYCFSRAARRTGQQGAIDGPRLEIHSLKQPILRCMSPPCAAL